MKIFLELKGVLKNKVKFLPSKEIRKIKLIGGERVIDIFKIIDLPKENVALITINGKVCNLESILKENDRVVFYPPIGGG